MRLHGFPELDELFASLRYLYMIGKILAMFWDTLNRFDFNIPDIPQVVEFSLQTRAPIIFTKSLTLPKTS